jgi:cytidylate kinase
MPIIFVCSVPFGGGEKLARGLADKLGYAYLDRDDVVAKATECGIPVGKLEVALLKKPSVRERLARLKERYLAVATATIAEKAAQGDLVYFGRAGHLLLPGVSHVIRVRAIPEPSQRLETAMTRIKLPVEKAETFLRDIDSDIRAWVRFVHGVEMDDLRRYDFVVNLEHMSVENAATALCGIADLPDFRPTPASRRAMEERLLQARARITLALDERTADADLTVRASDRVLTITYMPRQADLAAVIPDVLGDLPGCEEVRSTVATTNILWIQEEFRPESETLRQVNELARRWGAAVELIRYRPDDEEGAVAAVPVAVPASPGRAAPGGIEEDILETISVPDRAFRDTLESLVHAGRSGGGQTVAGGRDHLLTAISRDIPYSLVAVGEVFLGRPSATRVRLERELARFLGGHVKAPVISTSELGKQLGFGLKQALKLAAALLAVAAIYALLFSHQGVLLDVLGGPFHKEHSWLAPLVVACVAPLVAGLYGLVSSSLLKLIKLE